MRTRPEPGTRVRLTGAFLRSTGQVAGDEGRRRWVVQACDCAGCRTTLVCTDQATPADYLESMWTARELADNPSLRWRHIAFANLERAR